MVSVFQELEALLCEMVSVCERMEPLSSPALFVQLADLLSRARSRQPPVHALAAALSKAVLCAKQVTAFVIIYLSSIYMLP